MVPAPSLSGVPTWARRAALLVLATAPMWAHAQSALGDVDAMADVFEGPTPSPVTASDEQLQPSGVSVLAIAQTAHEQRQAHGFAQVNADPAGAGSGTFARARGDAGAGATAEATARWAFSDGLTIDRADLTGRAGVVTVAIRYGGHATADAVGDNTAWSSASLVARFGGDSAEASASASVRDGVRTEDPLTDVPGATRGSSCSPRRSHGARRSTCRSTASRASRATPPAWQRATRRPGCPVSGTASGPCPSTASPCATIS